MLQSLLRIDLGRGHTSVAHLLLFPGRVPVSPDTFCARLYEIRSSERGIR
jgi:hypothetical protein